MLPSPSPLPGIDRQIPTISLPLFPSAAIQNGRGIAQARAIPQKQPPSGSASLHSAIAFCIWLAPLVASLSQEPAEIPSHADLAFEQKDWSLAIRNYQAVLESDSLNGHAWLRIAQAQRALGLYVQALETLESALIVGAREAIIEFERARNFANLGRTEDSLVALSRANESGLRALSSLEGAEEFKAVRLRGEFQEIYSAIRRRVFPCEGIADCCIPTFASWVRGDEVRVQPYTRCHI